MISAHVLLLVSFAAHATPTEGMAVAIVPVAGERVSLEEVPLYERLDAALRSAAVSMGVKLQAAAATRAHLQGVRDSGIDCDLSDGQCLSKVAVLAEVDRLLVPIARREGSTFHVVMLAVDGAGRSREVRGDVTLTEDIAADHASARALIEQGMKAALAEPAAAIAAAPVVEPEVPAPAAKAPEVQGPWVGYAVMGGGGALVVGGAAGMLVVDNLLATPEPYEARQGKMAVGQLCLVAAAVGAAGVGVGAVLFAVGR